MKQYSYKIQKLREEDQKKNISDLPMIQLLRRELGKVGDWEPNPSLIMSSEEFEKYWRVYIDNIALFKETNDGKKKYRTQDYAAIGILDKNDLIQEAYTTFLEVYSKIDWEKVSEVHEEERAPFIWAWIKKTMKNRLMDNLRNQKDGIKVPHREVFNEKGKKIHNITGLFHMLDKMYMYKEDDLGLPRYETELIGFILEEVMDDSLDLNTKGEKKKSGIEKFVLMNIMGIDGAMTYNELSDYFGVSKQSLMSVKKRALKKLREPSVKRKISEYIKGYKIQTNADLENI